MSTDCCAPPDSVSLAWPSSPWRHAVRPTRALTRGVRSAALVAHLARMWLGAVLRTSRLNEAQRVHLVRRWAAGLVGVLRIRVRTRGHVPAEQCPVLLVANHVSWLDSYALNTVSGARFVAKEEVRGWPVIGTVAERFGTVFIRRGCYRSAARTVAALGRLLRLGRAVAAFPEATTTDGSILRRFHSAMFQAAVVTGAPVQPVAIRYRSADGSQTRAAAYVGEMSILGSLAQVLREPLITVELTFCPPIDPSGKTRRELAAQARAAIARALGAVAEGASDAGVDRRLRGAA